MRSRTAVLFVFLFLLAIVVSGGAADQPMADLPDQVEVNTGILIAYGETIEPPRLFQRIEGVWYCNEIQVRPKPGYSIEERVQELDDVGQLLKEVSEHIGQLRVQGIEGLELSKAKAELLRASSLVDSVKVLSATKLGIWYKDDPYPVLHLMSARMPTEPLTRDEDDDEQVYDKLIEPLQDGWTVYYSATGFYQKSPPGITLAESDLLPAIQREITAARESN